MRTRVAKLAFNRGLVSRLGIARADVKRLALAAETQVNWAPRVLGSMMLRPGLQHLGASQSDAVAFHIPFVFSVEDKALIEITNALMRVWVDDAVITRPTVTSAVTNGTFDANINNWTDNDEGTANTAWVTGGYMGFLSQNGTDAAIRDQTVSVTGANISVEHALKIVIQRGPVILRVGSTAGGDEYITETELATGYHSLAFTPTGDFRIRFMSRLLRQVLVDSCTVEAAGAMQVIAPWAAADLPLLRYDQSGDVVFVACGKTTDAIGYQQYRIERRGTRSWSVVKYYANDGPFMVENVGPITMTPSNLTANGSLTASAAYFKSTNVGSLFKVDSVGQNVSATVTAQNQFTSAIRVTGVDAERIFTLVLASLSATGTTITLQRSLTSDAGPWTDITNYTTDQTTPVDDGLDNQIAWYRIGCKTGNYVAGTIAISLAYTNGTVTALCRVTAYFSPTVVDIEIFEPFGSLTATDVWAEGQWSDRRGWPTAVAFHEGRLTWEGRDAIQASISDAFDGFDETFEGDAGPINRTIGSGPVDTINWALSLQRLVLGAQMAEFSVRSSSLDEVLTLTNFNIKAASTQGSAAVQGKKIDQNGIYVQRGGTRVFDLAFGSDGVDYQSSQLSALIPEIGQPSIVRMEVQRQPDTRVHFVRSDGTVALLVFDKLEEVIAWGEIETDGEIEDVVILPGDVGDEEDHVYYSVNRTINGSTKRYLEKWAFESECIGGTLNKQADCFIEYTQAASATITGLTHLAAETVVVWDNGKCLRTSAGAIATFVVTAGGEITVTNDGETYLATHGIVGLAYEAPWKSSMLVELMGQVGGSLTDTQQIKALSLILADVHAKGLLYGQSLTESEMNDLPESVDGAVVDPDAIRTAYILEPGAFPGTWTQDARLCLLAKAPRPCTVLAALAEVEHHG